MLQRLVHYIWPPFVIATLTGLASILVGLITEMGFRREYWLHVSSMRDFWSDAPLLAGLLFTVTFIVMLILRRRL
jgi:hypothetical protein